MVEEKTKQINGKKYIVPSDINERKHKHRDKKNWVSLWFYRERKKTSVKKKNIKPDFVITSKLEYQKDVFYKMTQLSLADDSFDYYYKLKENSTKNIVKKNSRYKNPKNKKKRPSWKDYKSNKPYKICEETGKFILTFE